MPREEKMSMHLTLSGVSYAYPSTPNPVLDNVSVVFP